MSDDGITWQEFEEYVRPFQQRYGNSIGVHWVIDRADPIVVVGESVSDEDFEELKRQALRVRTIKNRG